MAKNLLTHPHTYIMYDVKCLSGARMAEARMIFAGARMAGAGMAGAGSTHLFVYHRLKVGM